MPPRDRARYIVTDESWTDIPEAEPRCRVKLPVGAASVTVTVDAHGALTFPPGAGLQIDRYDDPPPDAPGRPRGEQAELYAAIRERRPPGPDFGGPRPTPPGPPQTPHGPPEDPGPPKEPGGGRPPRGR